MVLAEAIAEYEEAKKQKVPADILELMARTTRELIATGLTDQTTKVGESISSFTLPNHKGENASLADELQKGPVVLSFYRGGWCPYCNLELKALQQRLSDIEAAGATLIAISPELPDNSLNTTESNSLDFIVLSDIGNTVARQFGLIFTLSEDLQSVYTNFGLDIPARNGDGSWELPFPATFVIQPDGSVSLAFVDADYTHRLEPQAIVEHLNTI